MFFYIYFLIYKEIENQFRNLILLDEMENKEGNSIEYQEQKAKVMNLGEIY
jgi:hypothetical protein